METYKNSYTVNEDQVLWELHEIRHKLHKELQNTPLSEFNKSALDSFEQWKKERAQAKTMRVEQVIIPSREERYER